MALPTNFSLISCDHLFHFQFLYGRHDQVSFEQLLGIRCISIFFSIYFFFFYFAHCCFVFKTISTNQSTQSFLFFFTARFYFYLFSSFFETLQYSYCVYLRFLNIQTIFFLFAIFELFPSNFPAFKRIFLSKYIILFLAWFFFVWLCLLFGFVQFSILQ